MKTMRNILAGFLVLLTISFNLSAQQYDTPPTNTGTEKQVQTNMNNKSDMDDPNSPQYKYAVSMSKDIMNKLSLSFEQAEKIRDILVDYQQDVFDVKSRYSNLRNNGNTNNGNAANRTDGTTGNTNTNTDNNLTGGSTTDKMEAYQDADIDANDKIEDVLEETQIPKYNEIKKNWWSSIKQHVHSQAAFDEVNRMHDNTTGKNNKMGKNKDVDNTNTGTGTTKGTD